MRLVEKDALSSPFKFASYAIIVPFAPCERGGSLTVVHCFCARVVWFVEIILLNAEMGSFFFESFALLCIGLSPLGIRLTWGLKGVFLG